MKEVELNKEYNYSQMCEIFECEKKTSTDSRKAQLKVWGSLCNIERPKKGKYVITEIYSEPKEIENKTFNRGTKPKYLKYTMSLLDDYIIKLTEGSGNTITTSVYGIIDYIFDVNNDKINSTINELNSDFMEDAIANNEDLTNWGNQTKDIIKGMLYSVVEKSTLTPLSGKKYKQYTVTEDTINIIAKFDEDLYHYHKSEKLVEQYKEYKREYAKNCHLYNNNMMFATEEQWRICNLIFLNITSVREELEPLYPNLYKLIESKEPCLPRLQINYTITRHSVVEGVEEKKKNNEKDTKEIKKEEERIKKEKKKNLNLLKSIVYGKIGEKIQNSKKKYKEYELGYKFNLASRILDYIFNNLSEEAELSIKRLNTRIEELEREVAIQKETIRQLEEENKRLKREK